jgi:hypothetical protein
MVFIEQQGTLHPKPKSLSTYLLSASEFLNLKLKITCLFQSNLNDRIMMKFPSIVTLTLPVTTTAIMPIRVSLLAHWQALQGADVDLGDVPAEYAEEVGAALVCPK